ncbi:MAG: acetyl-CoA acetyltransferase [Candidatus Lambdaproteobacteria bacterium RIFOXYD12_FULL_49_8]|uniref:acetyl-CoA C-acyltransferase n=1 Tax=Candidatus Lambdaproteobacteria bacterium RIFOXYD2_FULL_50_16 TaxID=1817772 RepID=A0A1F6G8Q4_9PROT|nr:MAG: acetyl-CoA acetyltransferase [Candidatus Lambdaproteobacteria bacterium RIFOXYD2_FULL_50_16]OGG97336.1 MAG: acetyl-CoA acetyltransferase [Candidatus Lambdaproteobacteria bacterium RIFOXYD12_FULL_49_8]
METAYLVSAKRTAGCKAKKGKFAQTRPDELAAQAIKGALAGLDLDLATIDDVILGCAFPEGEQGMNLGRIAAMKAGLPQTVPGMTINRFCSSGLQAIALAVDRIKAGGAQAIVAGGAESMSLVPMGGNKYSADPTLMHDWPESYASMGVTAELVAAKYGINREDQDRFALQSHQRAAAAIAEGRFTNEIVPVEVEWAQLNGLKLAKSKELVAQDDGVRADTNLEALAKLKPIFKMDGSVTAGNSSQTTDGAAAVLVVSEAYLKAHNLTPIARLVSFTVTGCAPEIMGIGPIYAAPKAASLAGLSLNQIELFELNEAFAAQSLAVLGELKLDPSRVNVNGGAIALGHPLGCSGAKLTTTLLSELTRRKQQWGMVTMCIGGGMGAAGVFENLNR